MDISSTSSAVAAAPNSPPSPEQLLSALKARGVRPHRDDDIGEMLRDAVHEAAHAIDWKVPTPWTREAIAARAPRDRSSKFGAELLARAVETVLCERLGLTIRPLADRILLAGMEALQHDGYSVDHDQWMKAIEIALRSPRVPPLVEQILALVGPE